MDYGTLDNWYGTLPPPIICNTATIDLSDLDYWYGNAPPIIGADAGASISASMSASLSSSESASASATTTITLEQEGFRFRRDDGDEATATWLEDQDANATILRNTNYRIRFVVNSLSGDAPSTQFKLQYKKTSDEVWLDVPSSE